MEKKSLNYSNRFLTFPQKKKLLNSINIPPPPWWGKNQVLVWLVYVHKKTCSPVQRNPSFTHTFTHAVVKSSHSTSSPLFWLFFYLQSTQQDTEKNKTEIFNYHLSFFSYFISFWKYFLKELLSDAKEMAHFEWGVGKWTERLFLKPFEPVTCPWTVCVSLYKHTWWFSDFQIAAWEGGHTFGLKQQCLWVGGAKLTSETTWSHWSCAFSGFGLWWWKNSIMCCAIV